jgi:tripartite-type tricarboxylate transporter receptor subunit TctC
VEGVEWFGLFVPTATPAEFVSGLNASVCKTLDVDAVKTSLAKQSFEPRACMPAELALLVKAALESWRAKVKASGFKSMD